MSYHDIQGLFKLIAKQWSPQNQEKIISQYEILEIIRNWEEIAGRSLASHSLPEKLRKNILWVNTDHSVFAQQIQELSNKILQKVREQLGIKINQIRTKIMFLQWNASQNGYISIKSENRQFPYNTGSMNHKKKEKDIMSTPGKMTLGETDFDRFILKIQSLSHNKKSV